MSLTWGKEHYELRVHYTPLVMLGDVGDMLFSSAQHSPP